MLEGSGFGFMCQLFIWCMCHQHQLWNLLVWLWFFLASVTPLSHHVFGTQRVFCTRQFLSDRILFQKQRNENYTRMTWDLFCRTQLTQKQYTCPFLRAAYPLASCLPEGELNTALLSDSHSKNGWRFSEWLCWELLEGFCSSHYVTVSTYR